MKLPTPSNFEPAPAGNHRAVCIQVIDLGTQTDRFGTKHKIRIAWELTDTQMEDGRPFIISQDYTFSMGERSNLRQMFVSWRGRDFTDDEFETFRMENILGAPCLLNVVHRQKQNGHGSYAAIAGISTLPKGMEKPEPSQPQVIFDLQDPDQAVFSELSDWLQEKILESPEGQAWYTGNPTQDDRGPLMTPSPAQQKYEQGDEIPF